MLRHIENRSSRKSVDVDWRGKLEAECLQRLKRERSSLLQRLRTAGQDAVRADLSALVRQACSSVTPSSTGAQGQACTSAGHHAPGPTPWGTGLCSPNALLDTSNIPSAQHAALPTLQVPQGPSQGPSHGSHMEEDWGPFHSAAFLPAPAVTALNNDTHSTTQWRSQSGSSTDCTMCFSSQSAACTQSLRSVSLPAAARSHSEQLSDVVWQLSSQEYQALMCQLEHQLLQEQLEYEERALQQQQQQEVQAVADTFYADCGEETAVICPICRCNYLMQLNGVIACTCRRLRLDVGAEGVTLDKFQQRLAAVSDVRDQQAAFIG